MAVNRNKYSAFNWVRLKWLMINDKHLRAAITVRLLQKSIVLIKSPGGAAITVRLLQKLQC